MSGRVYKILAVNLGSTSSKLAAYENEERIFGESIAHSRQELERAGPVFEQYEYRLEAITRRLGEQGLGFADFDILV